jgi:hypothetical protein
MGDRTGSVKAFRAAESRARLSGPSVTFRAEQVQKETGKINPLVDPKGHGVIRRSISRKDQVGDHWVMTIGTAMPVELRLDTTSSMGDNVDRAMSVLPTTYSLLAQVPGAVLGRYDTQMANQIFNDVDDSGPVLCRTQFEMDVEIANQLTMMIPVRAGGDHPEDPQYGMFASVYLTAAEIHELGLRGYDFTVTDATAHEDINLRTLESVFGDQVIEKVAENGHQISERSLPQMGDIIRELLEVSHAFLLSVDSGNVSYWERFYGSERVVVLPRTELLPQVQAAIIGLTEGTLNLQTVEKFLVENTDTAPGEAEQVLRAVSHIPLGAQVMLPNFDKIPVKGSQFKNKEDLWPMADEEVTIEEEEESAGMWDV